MYRPLGHPRSPSVLSEVVTRIRHSFSASWTASEPRTHRARKFVLGVLYGFLSGAFFAVCAASVKALEATDPGQLAVYQYLAIAAFSLPMVVKRGRPVLGSSPATKYWLLLCGVFDAATVYLAFVSFRYLSLAVATVLTSSVPVFVAVAARVFLKERCTATQVLAIAVSLLGVVLVGRLSFAAGTHPYAPLGLLAALGSLATESGVYVLLRKLKHVDVFVVLFDFGLVAALVDAGLTASFGHFTWKACGVQRWLVLGVGVSSFLSQLCLTRALELEEAGPVSVLMAAGDILFAFFFDVVLFRDVPDAYTISGTLLIAGSVVVVGCKRWLDGDACCRRLKATVL